MLDLVFSNRFKRDLKLLAKRGLDLDLLDEVIEKLRKRQPLDKKYKDHSLTGDYAGFRECHVLPDWLLIYRIDEEELFLFLLRSGTRSTFFSVL